MLTYLIRLEMSKMDIMENLKFEVENLIRKNVTLGIEYYKLKYPDEEFQVPEVIISFDFHKDTINIYKEFNYPSDYINLVNKTANWDTTIALTISNYNQIDQSKIILNAFKLRDDTILHELTHVSDFSNYITRHNYSGLNYLEFSNLKNSIYIHLFSEFRAFYRGALYSNENLRQRLEYENSTLITKQTEAIQKHNIKEYYYHSIKYIGFYCACIDKNLPQETIEQILQKKDENVMQTLVKFLYPLRNKAFIELESHINEFQDILNKMIDKS